MGVFSMAVIAMLGAVQIAPPERVFANLDMCLAAKAGTMEDLHAAGAIILTARCDLRQLAPMK
jgi:hypothetical protein